jgi:hypothetical protein
LTIALSVTVSVAAAVTINQTLDDDAGWSARGTTAATSFKVTVNRQLEVKNDIRISGSELQLVASTCTDRAPKGEGYICFDRDSMRFRVSQDGAPYVDLAGPPAQLVAPGCMTPGSRPLLSGSGFPPDARIAVTTGGISLGTATANPDGAFRTTLLVPQTLRTRELYSLRASVDGTAWATHPIFVPCDAIS